MNTFWTTLLEINLVLSIVYLGYRLLLKNLTFFRWTRAYLAGGMLTGLAYPFLKVQQAVHTPAEGLTIAIPDISQAGLVRGTDYNQWAVYLVSAVFLVLFLKFLVPFFSLGKIHFASDNAQFNGLKFRNTRRQINPFSFWKWIYIHRNSHSDREMGQIVAHEHIHTRERHTLDVLIAEICTIICWYNPLVKHLARAVKDNLEFLVDAQVLHSGIDRVSYQHSLVGVSLSRFPQPSHGNQFAYKTLKKRILMMNKDQSPQSRLLAYLLLTPMVLACAGLLTVSCQKESLDTFAKSKEGEGIVLERTFAASETTKKPGIEKIEFKASSPGQGLFIEGHSSLAGENNTASVTLKGVHTSKEAPLIILDGKETTNDLSTVSPDQIQAISVLKGKSAIEKYGEKGENGVIEIYLKKSPR